MPSWSAPGAEIHYELWGDETSRPWATLVNGHTRTLRDFRAMGNFLVERGFRVLALDNRGAGRTVTSAPFRLEDMVADVEGLWSHLGCRATHLLGISMGGMIAMRLAAKRPAGLQSLVLVSTTPHREATGDGDSLAGKSGEEIEERLLRYFSPDFATRQKLLIRSMVKDLSKAFSDEAIARGTQAQRAALEGFDARDEIPRIAVPTLVIHGSEDRILRVDRARELASLIPGASLEIFEGAGHLLLAEAARKLYTVAADFFEAVEGKSHGG